jgi:transcription initiation factor TFIIB
MHKWHTRATFAGGHDRNLIDAFTQIKKLASNMGMPRYVAEEAAFTYKKSVGKGLFYGRAIEEAATAALYHSCRLAGLPRTLDEFAEQLVTRPEGDISKKTRETWMRAVRAKRKAIGKTFRKMARVLGLDTRVPEPQAYLPRMCSELKLAETTRHVASDIIKDAGIMDGRAPMSIATAALYIATKICNEDRTQSEIAAVGSVTEVTVRNRYTEMTQRLGMDLERPETYQRYAPKNTTEISDLVSG